MLNEYQRRELRLKKEAKQERARIVEAGNCPQCGKKLVKNLAIIGWYQCENYPQDTGCHYQVFL